MKNILIAAAIAGIAGAATILYLRNRNQKPGQLNPAYDPSDHHRNPIGKMMRSLKSNGKESLQ